LARQRRRAVRGGRSGKALRAKAEAEDSGSTGKQDRKQRASNIMQERKGKYSGARVQRRLSRGRSGRMNSSRKRNVIALKGDQIPLG
jgi:hypothetical protein